MEDSRFNDENGTKITPVMVDVPFFFFFKRSKTGFFVWRSEVLVGDL